LCLLGILASVHKTMELRIHRGMAVALAIAHLHFCGNFRNAIGLHEGSLATVLDLLSGDFDAIANAILGGGVVEEVVCNRRSFVIRSLRWLCVWLNCFGDVWVSRAPNPALSLVLLGLGMLFVQLSPVRHTRAWRAPKPCSVQDPSGGMSHLFSFTLPCAPLRENGGGELYHTFLNGL
jgi:hypothetical protein